MDISVIIYLFLFLLLIYKTNFFSLFKDDALSPRTVTLIFLLKCTAVPVFILVYKKLYGGLEKFDAGIFYHDAKALNQLAFTNFTEYLKALVGLQDDAPGSYFYNHYIIYTNNWDNGRLAGFFYNDNRVIIRLHSFIHFLPFAGYNVHALVSCFISYMGLFYLYKTFKNNFVGKELAFMLVICFFPSLWFYTGAVLKEGLVIFILGSTAFLLKTFTIGERKMIRASCLAYLLFVSLFLKPYFLYPAAFCFLMYFLISGQAKIKYKFTVFLFIMSVFIVLVNTLLYFTKDESLLSLALRRQQVFANAAKGGLYLENATRLCRLNLDTTLISKTPGANTYHIKKDVPYIYWEHVHQSDTLLCSANVDTLGTYTLVDRVPAGGSNIDISSYQGNYTTQLWKGFYYALLFPLFFNAVGPFQLLASLENFMLIISLAILVWGTLSNKRDRFLPLVFLFFALSLCVLTGITTPNSGAIFRYRSPAVIFIILAALFYLPPLWNKIFKRRY